MSSPQFSPAGDRLAFLAETGGDAKEEKKAAAQVFVLPMNAGEPQPITNAPNGVEQFAWRPNGKDIAYVTSDDPPNFAFRKAFILRASMYWRGTPYESRLRSAPRSSKSEPN